MSLLAAAPTKWTEPGGDVVSTTSIPSLRMIRAAAGIAVELTELSVLGARRVVTRTVTNSDGRTDQPLIGGRPVPIGRYELMFSVGKYFAERQVPTSDPPFLDQIPLRFSVSEPEGHLHVPLLVTPWSYATYRGS